VQVLFDLMQVLWAVIQVYWDWMHPSKDALQTLFEPVQLLTEAGVDFLQPEEDFNKAMQVLGEVVNEP